jgi:DNA-binding transcriptional MerR regulator
VLIGELAARTGVSHRMLRYYEEQGLLLSEREPNGYRRYDADAVRTVQAIRALLAVGLGTGVIASVLPCALAGEPLGLDLCPELVSTLRAELAGMDGRIEAMRCTRGALASLLD